METRVHRGKNDTTGSLEPLQLHEYRLLIASSINTVNNGNIVIEVLNPTEEVPTIKKNRKLGTFVSVMGANANGIQPSDSKENHENLVCSRVILDKTELTTPQKGVFGELLNKYADVLGTSENDLECTPTMTFDIDVQGATPVKQRYRRFHGPLREEVNNEMDKLLYKGIIEPSASP